jgi:hypothetical protein
MAERSWSEVWTESVAPEIVTFDCLESPLDWKEDMKKLTNKVAVGKQCGRVLVRTARRDHRRSIPLAVQHECAWPPLGDSGSREIVRTGGRERH